MYVTIFCLVSRYASSDILHKSLIISYTNVHVSPSDIIQYGPSMPGTLEATDTDIGICLDEYIYRRIA